MDSAFGGGMPDYGADVDPMKAHDVETENNGFDHVFDGMKQFAIPRHKSGSSNAGINVLFFDLSARHVKIKEVWTLKWNKKHDVGGYTQNGNSWPASGWMDKFTDDF
jgi:hypothetical protein